MTPEVKKRIEQIRQGIVPEGYVKDKDGIYPRDWASKKIGQWLKLAERSIVLQDKEEYQLVTIRRGFGGVDSRGSFLGKNVLVKNYFIVKTGDFIISKRQIAHGACGIVPPELDGAVVSNEYNVFLPQDGTNIQMFNLMMQLPHYKRLFYLMSDGVHIEKLLFKTQDWMKRTLAMPLLKEQKKIAEILSTQDKAIELQGRKIEELKRFKKGCLEKMFPRKGQKVPEKRFPGFTDDWEQRKLGDISEIKTGPFGSTLHADDYVSDGTPIITTEHFKTGALPRSKNGLPQVSDSDYKRLTAYTLDDGDIVFSRVGSVDINALITPFQSNWLFSGRVLRVRPQTDISSKFLHTRLETESIKTDIRTRAVGQTMPSINTEILKITPLVLPSSAAEQEQIGSYFAALDNLITLHQRKLEEMKRQKKALMQLLLTGIVRVRL